MDNRPSNRSDLYVGEPTGNDLSTSNQHFDFSAWVDTYQGRKFDFIHIDSEVINYSIAWWLENQNKYISYAAHLMIWVRPQYYCERVSRLKLSGWEVHPMPLIWHKTGMKPNGLGINENPRQTYDMALLAVRGNRQFKRQFTNSYACPRPTPPLYPNQKPEPMLRHFFAGLVDETTDFFDPSPSGGVSCKAAQSLNCHSHLHL